MELKRQKAQGFEFLTSIGSEMCFLFLQTTLNRLCPHLHVYIYICCENHASSQPTPIDVASIPRTLMLP